MKLKLNLNKKMLMTVGIYVGAFVVINVGMYFFLSMTQPKLGARVGMAGTPADSLAVDSLFMAARHDSTSAHGDSLPAQLARADSARPASDSLLAQTQGPDSLHGSNTAIETMSPPETPPVDGAPTEVAAAETSAETDVEAAVPVAPITDANSAAEMAKLAKAMEAMKPAAAAAIAGQLTTDQIVALVMRMKDRTAGRMLAALPPDQAAQVALRMSAATMQAGRK